MFEALIDWPRGAVRAGLDFVLPPRCPSCGVQTGSLGGLCPDCWRQVRFLSEPACAQCGYPFELDFGPGARCGACLARPPDFDEARAAVAYDDRVAKLVISLKHSDRTDLAPWLSAWMARAGAEMMAACDWIAPVPLHRRRLFDRRYNQSMLLAAPLAARAEKPLIGDLIRRRRRTDSQGHLSPAARRRNVDGAFRTDPTRKAELKGQHVLLIDDVLTTGATANAIARRLKRDGAARVSVLTLARVVRATAPE